MVVLFIVAAAIVCGCGFLAGLHPVAAAAVGLLAGCAITAAAIGGWFTEPPAHFERVGPHLVHIYGDNPLSDKNVRRACPQGAADVRATPYSDEGYVRCAASRHPTREGG